MVRYSLGHLVVYKSVCLCVRCGGGCVVCTCMVLKTSSAIPWPSTLMRCGWNSASGASNRSPPTLITRPSGNCGQNVYFQQTTSKNLFLVGQPLFGLATIKAVIAICHECRRCHGIHTKKRTANQTQSRFYHYIHHPNSPAADRTCDLSHKRYSCYHP